MPIPSAAALVVAFAALAGPAKQTWDSVVKPGTNAEFLPHTALVEVDGKARGRGWLNLDVSDPTRIFHVRVSADGFEPAEASVEAARIVDRRFLLALRPLGFAQRVDTADPRSTALAAAALWEAGRVDDAAEYAELSLATGNTPLANRVLGDVWRRRGDRDQATRYYTMYLSLTDNPPDAPEIRAWLLRPKDGDITVPAR